MCITASFTMAKIWVQPRCPLTDEWIKKMWYVYTREYHSAIKMSDNLSFAVKRLEMEDIMLSEISQTQKYKYYTCENLKKK
jgi:hypothetical protein